MSEAHTTIVEQTNTAPQSEDEKEENAEIVSIKRGKLLKLRHQIESLRQQFQDENKEVEEWKNQTCEKTKTLIGELNDNIKQGGSTD